MVFVKSMECVATGTTTGSSRIVVPDCLFDFVHIFYSLGQVQLLRLWSTLVLLRRVQLRHDQEYMIVSLCFHSSFPLLRVSSTVVVLE